ncbi:hypothetical protein ACJDU8_02290 [Clostridium sp. WILCCON 0269]|uniref:Uncharacterized protein n=1 Tax=Candidatus Clostridium eludens TaxID=3381663 RepID=A0ABW8SGN8_9CLOT
MPVLSLNKIQFRKIDNSKRINTPTSEEYIVETQKNNELLREKIYEYTEAYKNASQYYVK